MIEGKRAITEEEYHRAFRNGITRLSVRKRYYYGGFTLEEAITLPRGYRKERPVIVDSLTDEQYATAWANGISKTTARSRYMELGYTVEEAITLPRGGKKWGTPAVKVY